MSFVKKDFVSPVQRDAIKAVLEVGHAAMHRKFNPTQHDLNTALDITEGIFAAIYVHTPVANNLSNRVPRRTPSGKIIPWKSAIKTEDQREANKKSSDDLEES